MMLLALMPLRFACHGCYFIAIIIHATESSKGQRACKEGAREREEREKETQRERGAGEEEVGAGSLGEGGGGLRELGRRRERQIESQ